MNFLCSYYNNSELKSYFKAEYKDDWEFAYADFLETKKNNGKSKNIFRTIVATLFHTHKG
jgi:hypothetical protein